MATSGTYAFDLPADGIVVEAFERAGIERAALSGTMLRSAATSLNLILSHWSNRGINLWAMEEITQALTAGTESYVLDDRVVDVIDAFVRSGTTDYPLYPIGRNDYVSLSNKDSAGIPSQFWTHRTATDPTIYLYPTPGEADTLHMWCLRRLQDVGGYTNDLDLPARWLEAVCAELAYRVAQKFAKTKTTSPDGSVNFRKDPDTIAALKVDAMEAFQIAAAEDRDRGPWSIVPDLSAYSG